MAQEQLTEEQVHELTKVARNLGFATALKTLRKPAPFEVKSASQNGGTPAVEMRYAGEFSDEEVKELTVKYANEWIPNIEKLSAGYLRIICGEAA